MTIKWFKEKPNKVEELSDDAKQYLNKLERGLPKATGRSALASDRLMKELSGVYRSEFHKKGTILSYVYNSLVGHIVTIPALYHTW